jgi:hypothetical protein
VEPERFENPAGFQLGEDNSGQQPFGLVMRV